MKIHELILLQEAGEEEEEEQEPDLEVNVRTVPYDRRSSF
jgi:hypothetical protein